MRHHPLLAPSLRGVISSIAFFCGAISSRLLLRAFFRCGRSFVAGLLALRRSLAAVSPYGCILSWRCSLGVASFCGGVLSRPRHFVAPSPCGGRSFVARIFPLRAFFCCGRSFAAGVLLRRGFFRGAIVARVSRRAFFCGGRSLAASVCLLWAFFRYRGPSRRRQILSPLEFPRRLNFLAARISSPP